jgi:hypothetical protein
MLPSSLSITLVVRILEHLPHRSPIAFGRESTAGRFPSTRLPSIRALSAEIGVARAVVEGAYEQLITEGRREARRGSGAYVRHLPVHKPVPTVASRTPPTTPPDQHRIRLTVGSPGFPIGSPRRGRGRGGHGSIPQAYPDTVRRPPRPHVRDGRCSTSLSTPTAWPPTPSSEHRPTLGPSTSPFPPIPDRRTSPGRSPSSTHRLRGAATTL